MPVHDWSRVMAGFFHDCHHAWIEELKRALNSKVLPNEYYAMAEQVTGAFGPDVLTLQGSTSDSSPSINGSSNGQLSTIDSNPGEGNVGLAEPRIALTGETEIEFYRHKKSMVAIRHVSDDRVVAMIEVVSPVNKNNRQGITTFVRKVAELLDQGIHLLILDLLPPGPRDPHGLHSCIWEYLEGEELAKPDKPLMLAVYETDLTVRAYVVNVAVGETLTDMLLFLAPQACVEVPLEETYMSAFAAFPRRWRHLLD